MKLNLASHGDNREGYINIDFDHPTADLKCDVTELPMKDGEVDKILAYHILEHFRAGNYEPHLSNPINPKTAKEALQEWYRVLMVGGTLEIKVPDFSKIIWLYQNFPQWCRADSPVLSPFKNFSDWIISNGQHQCLFDKDTMMTLLKSIGFIDIVFLDHTPEAYIGRENLEMYVTCHK